MSYKNIKTRIILKDSKGTLKKFINIQTIYKVSSFFEYKFTIEGFPKNNKSFTFIKNAVLDSMKGLHRGDSEEHLQGWMEFSYHADGQVAYKNILGKGNINPKVKNIPILKINKPSLFFRVVGFNINELSTIDNIANPQDGILDLDKFSTEDCLTCDFYLSRYKSKENKKYALTLKNDSPFKNSCFFEDFFDENQGIYLHLHFYKTTSKDKFFMVIPTRGPIQKLKQWLFYLFYSLKNTK